MKSNGFHGTAAFGGTSSGATVAEVIHRLLTPCAGSPLQFSRSRELILVPLRGGVLHLRFPTRVGAAADDVSSITLPGGVISVGTTD
ncbi:protein of unknown function [Bradyrhizobium vignae]|uniref:Uncharacterized protein n=1 Tax=Bradyrhizobium vignae TaxID=1549949 RepID=A0A2U3Q863_9BRAD|nr:protein of unknown function [Bradyrhizobium vignae]